MRYLQQFIYLYKKTTLETQLIPFIDNFLAFVKKLAILRSGLRPVQEAVL